MNFESSLKKVLEWEGGYTNDPDDAGGETNYGITREEAVRWGYLDSMRAIPMELVKKIYRADYWDKICCDSLPEHVRLFALDTAVNMGVGKWKKYMSEGLGAENNWDLDALYARRKKSYIEISAIKNNAKYLKGWLNRLEDIYRACKNETITMYKLEQALDLSKVIQIAEDEVGKNIREDNGDNRDLKKEIEKYWIGSVYPDGFCEGAPYCCAFATWVFNAAGIPIPRYVACESLALWAKKGGSDKVKALFLSKCEKPEPGDLVLFDTGREGLFNHIGIVENVRENTLTTIEGNTVAIGENSNNNPVGGVYKKTVNRFGNISGYIRILGVAEDGLQTLSPEDTFISILKQKQNIQQISGMQLLCNLLLKECLKIDGILGPKTEAALRKLFKKV